MSSKNCQRTKSEVAERFKVSPNSITCSRLSDTGYWNFDVAEDKFGSELYFIFHDQTRDKYNVAIVPARSIDISRLRRKGNTVRFVVNTDYEDNSGLSFRPYLQ